MTARDCTAIGILTLTLLGGTASSTRAQNRQPPITEIRAPEIFGHIGRFRAGTDEGAIGSAVSYGGLILIPLSARFAVDVDVQTSRVARTRISRGTPTYAASL